MVDIVPVPNVRITIIDKEGKVLFDRDLDNYRDMENHIKEPEVREAINSISSAVPQGADIGKEY